MGGESILDASGLCLPADEDTTQGFPKSWKKLARLLLNHLLSCPVCTQKDLGLQEGREWVLVLFCFVPLPIVGDKEDSLSLCNVREGVQSNISTDWCAWKMGNGNTCLPESWHSLCWCEQGSSRWVEGEESRARRVAPRHHWPSRGTWNVPPIARPGIKYLGSSCLVGTHSGGFQSSNNREQDALGPAVVWSKFRQELIQPDQAVRVGSPG